ncbi:MAG: hypothetical protein Q7S31_00290 [bacterium]|nr:hypothetical protein [bacterium]
MDEATLDKLQNILKTRGQETLNELPLLAEDQINLFEHIMSLFGQCFPESILIGGWALRLYLRQNGYPIPEVPYKPELLDLDYALDPEIFIQLRGLFRAPEDKDFIFKSTPFPAQKSEQIKKYFARKLRGFDKADRILQLENNDTNPSRRKHIEVFSKELVQSSKYSVIPISGTDIQVISPNENFRTRFNKIKKILDEAEKQNGKKIDLVSKNFSYLYLNSLVVDWSDFSREEKLDILTLIKKIDYGVIEGKINLTNEVA